ncbi:MAG: Holliday junction branch migration DNA helicase RuvB, partial [Gammaproteobacteria bacterium]|nr:Holliday junction branch migration DNA helicase RuvB [Gammaproteobacteria bacterium]
FEVDTQGLDGMDTTYLLTIIEKFSGGPVGIETLSAAIGEDRGTLEEVVEPFLIQKGFLMRTRSGRVATQKAWRHLGLRGGPTMEGELDLDPDD